MRKTFLGVTLVVLAACHITGQHSPAVTLTAPATDVPLGWSLRINATLTHADGTTTDVTEQAVWSSSEPSILTVSNDPGQRGVIRGMALGSSDLTAEVTDGGRTVHATITFTVQQATAAVLSVDPLTLAAGTQGQARAFAVMSDGSRAEVTSSCQWTISDASLGSISNDTGRWGQVSTSKAGRATLTATLSGMAATNTVTVTAATLQSLDVLPAANSIPAGETVTLSAQGHFSDGTVQDLTQQVAWSTADLSLVVSSSGGKATPLKPGVYAVNAARDGISGSAAVVGLDAVITSLAELRPTGLTLAMGQEATLKLLARLSDGSEADVTQLAGVSYTVDNSALLGFGTQPGTVIGRAPGTATVTAHFQGFSIGLQITISATTAPAPNDIVAIQIGPSNASVIEGETSAFSATCTLANGSTANCTNTVSWSSSDATVLAVGGFCFSNNCAEGMHPGTATLRASAGTVMSNAVSVTVLSSLPPLQVARVWPILAAVGQNVSITGTGFSPIVSENQVTDAAGTPFTVTAATAGGLSVAVPNGAVSGPLKITVRGATQISADELLVKLPVAMSVISISPMPYTVTTLDGRLTDGDLGSQCYTTGLPATEYYEWITAAPTSIVIDLGSVQPVSRVGFTIADTGQGTVSGVPTNGTLSVSNDLSTWAQIGSVGFSPGSQCTVRGLQVKGSASSTGRYVKLTLQLNLGLPVLYEVAVSGS